LSTAGRSAKVTKVGETCFTQADILDTDAGLDADSGSIWSEESLSYSPADWRSGIVKREGPPQRTFACSCGYTYVAKGADIATVADIFVKARWRHNNKWHPEELDKPRLESGWIQPATEDVPQAERSWVCRICLAALPCMPQRPLKTSAMMHLSGHTELNLRQLESEDVSSSWSTGGWSTVPAAACIDPSWVCPVCSDCLPQGLSERQVREARLLHWKSTHAELDRRTWTNLLQGYATDTNHRADGHDIVHFRVPFKEWVFSDGKVREIKNKKVLLTTWCRKCCLQLRNSKKGKTCGTKRTSLSWWRQLQGKFPATARRLTKTLGLTAKAFKKQCSETKAGHKPS
jgi:hypothetical protein